MDTELGDHAVVLGASMAGLLAARTLSGRYRRVTLVERDTIRDRAGARPAVPQGVHIHALLARGQQILDQFHPGFTEELVAAGAPVGDFGTSLAWYFNGQMIKKTRTGLICLAAGRPMLEAHLRARTLALPGVELRENTDIVGLYAPDPARVSGARIRSRAEGAEEEILEADLVVDATGRGSRTPRWLEELGYPAVEQEKVTMDLTYTTCDFKGPLKTDPIGEDIALLPVATPDMPRGAIFARLPDRYAVSLTGILGDKPPTDHEGFLEYVKTLPVPEIYDAVRDAEPMGPPQSFHFPASVRKRFERMSRLPDRYLVIGDAAAVFNPVYGQGMTVAAIEATVLDRQLRDGVPSPKTFQKGIAKVIDGPWDMAAGADLGFPGVQGRRTAKVRAGNVFVPRLQAAAVTDEVLSNAFLRAAGLIDPPEALMRPGVVGRVLKRR